MGSIQSKYNQINFEDMQHFIYNCNTSIIINTLNQNEQNCIIKNTIDVNDEVKIINENIDNNLNKNIIIYGKNYMDKSIYKKYDQLKSLYCDNIYIYPGGLFEWLTLQDIYGKENFPTNCIELDILKYKPMSFFHQTKLLEKQSF